MKGEQPDSPGPVAPPPRISVGIPVFNGERYLAGALDSVLAQTARDFEVVVSDNGSTDGTEAICRRYAAQDPRVRVERQPDNRGAAWNFNRLVELARGTYFAWLAHDDAWAPDYLARCAARLDEDPEVVLAYTYAVDVDEGGALIGPHRIALDVGSIYPHRRLQDLICIEHACLPVFGLTRLAVLRQTSRIGTYVASDRVLLAQLGLAGRFAEIPEPLFVHRQHGGRSTEVIPTLHARGEWFDPSLRGRVTFPVWRIGREYVASIGRARLGRRQRVYCYLQMARWAAVHTGRLLRDLVMALSHLVRFRRGSYHPPRVGTASS